MTAFDWHDLMTRYNTAIFNSKYRRYLTPDLIEKQWLGQPGATEGQLDLLEKRLGYTLPPSYRAFLAYSNGWGMTSPHIFRVWSTQDVDWFHLNHQGWIDLYTDSVSIGEATDFVSAVQMHGLEDGLTPFQALPALHLETALEISEVGDAAIYLLNRQVIDSDGEWEAWLFADWLPGAKRYRSFTDLMLAEYNHFVAQHGVPAP